MIKSSLDPPQIISQLHQSCHTSLKFAKSHRDTNRNTFYNFIKFNVVATRYAVDFAERLNVPEAEANLYRVYNRPVT